MSKYNSLGGLFTAIANAIRAKTGGTDPIVAEDFPAAVEGISAGGGLACGSYVAAQNISYFSSDVRVEHNLGYVPTHMIQLFKTESGNESWGYSAAYIYADEKSVFAIQSPGSSSYMQMMITDTHTFERDCLPTETDFLLTGNFGGLYSIQLKAGQEALWFVW